MHRKFADMIEKLLRSERLRKKNPLAKEKTSVVKSTSSGIVSVSM